MANQLHGLLLSSIVIGSFTHRMLVFHLCLWCSIFHCDVIVRSAVIAQVAEAASADKEIPARHSDSPITNAQIDELSKRAIKLLEDGSFLEAVKVQRQLVSNLQSFLGKNHWRTAAEEAFFTEVSRASALDKNLQSKYLLARKRSLEASQRTSLEDYEQAEELLNKSIADFQKTVGVSCNSAATTIERLGKLDLIKEDHAAAKMHLSQSLALWKQVTGESHPCYANGLALLGHAYFESTDFAQAEKHFRSALKIQRRAIGSQSPVYAETLGKLSAVLIEENKLLESEAICLQAISIAEAFQLHDSVQMAYFLDNLSKIDVAYEDYGFADRHLQRALSLYENLLPPWSPILAKGFERRAAILRKLGRIDDAASMDAKVDLIRSQK